MPQSLTIKCCGCPEEVRIEGNLSGSFDVTHDVRMKGWITLRPVGMPGQHEVLCVKCCAHLPEPAINRLNEMFTAGAMPGVSPLAYLGNLLTGERS